MKQSSANLNRRSFLTKGCACGALLLADASTGLAQTNNAAVLKDKYTHPVNPSQVMAVLTDIDRTGDQVLIDGVFTRWGYQCFHTRDKLLAFFERYRNKVQDYADYVNADKSRYWEKLEYNVPAGIIKVTSRKFGKCPCAYAQCQQPAKALCTHCCKAFQVELFRMLTGHEVTVHIDEGILLGNERCCTTVRVSQEKAKTV